jgi:dipeptidyl aminopeptidase/acylaminoacyl peptidase
MVGVVIGALAQQRHTIQPSDCVTVRYLQKDESYRSSIQINPQGTRFAYLVRSPNLVTNTNDIALYVEQISPLKSSASRALRVENAISSMQWLADGRRLALLVGNSHRRHIEIIDISTGAYEIVASPEADVSEFSISGSGSVVVFTVRAAVSTSATDASPDDIAKGYLISPQFEATQSFRQWHVFAMHRLKVGWSRPKAIVITSPFSHLRLTDLPSLAGLLLSLSPNGRLLLLQYFDTGENMPSEWKTDPYMQILFDNGFSGPPLTVLYDMQTSRATVPIKTTWAKSVPLWSPNGESFAIVAQSPVGSRWEHEDIEDSTYVHYGKHLFCINTRTGLITEVVPQVENVEEQPLSWLADGDILVHTSSREIEQFGYMKGAWRSKVKMTIPLDDFYRFGALASDGNHVVGEYQNTVTPPEIFAYRNGKDEVAIVRRLNPQLDNLRLAQVKDIAWATSTGYKANGYLFVPPDYVEGTRYPLVIQTKLNEGGFMCDSGIEHAPSFAPQPMAASGIMYLVGTYPEKGWDQEKFYPKGYPGGISEAVFNMDLWDSAIDKLNALGFIDRNRVGVMGFSRTGWYVEFMLAHSKHLYAAATATDNVQYSFGEYWYLRSGRTTNAYDAMYGGPPYGETFPSWRDYSISFNLDKVHTPLLLEEMGYGIKYDNIHTPPDSLAVSFEIFSGLNRIGKPVELYYYPNESHLPDHPLARLASLQRNVDWYRFWLQGYQRPNPEDPNQYGRWQHMKELLDSGSTGRFLFSDSR